MTTQNGEPSAFAALLLEAARISKVAAPVSGADIPLGSSLLAGRIRLLRQLGEGGSGVVFEAFDEQRQGRVALKLLRQSDPANVYRLKNEFRTLCSLSHPNVVRLHELFVEESRWFFTMEVVEGMPFDQWVRPKGRLHEARLRAALAELVPAIDSIHRAGKLHRDLKPSNVLITAEARVVVLDFGLAIEGAPGGIGNTLEDRKLSGTPAFMAPEQAAGAPASAASDHYALGVMLFEGEARNSRERRLSAQHEDTQGRALGGHVCLHGSLAAPRARPGRRPPTDVALDESASVRLGRRLLRAARSSAQRSRHVARPHQPSGRCAQESGAAFSARAARQRHVRQSLESSGGPRARRVAGRRRRIAQLRPFARESARRAGRGSRARAEPARTLGGGGGGRPLSP